MATPQKPGVLTSVVTKAIAVGSKIAPVSTDRNVAQVQAPQAAQGEQRTKIYTYLTKADGLTYKLYTADRLWARVKLELQTGGPVAVGDASNLGDPTSGVGIELTTNEPRDFMIAKGNVLYIAANTVNRVAVTIEPLPWLEQVTALITNVIVAIGGLAGALVKK